MPARCHRFARLGPERIDESDEPEQPEPAKLRLDIRRRERPLVRHRLRRNGEHAQPLLGHALCRKMRIRAAVFAKRQDDFGRALGMQPEAVVVRVQRGGEAPLRREGDFADARGPGANIRELKSGLHREHEERHVERVAASSRIAAGRMVGRIVAERRRDGRFRNRRQAGGAGLRGIEVEVAARIVSLASDLRLAEIGKPKALGGQRVGGERAGLVACHHRAGPEPLHGREVADDDVATCHAPRRDRERHRHGNGQALRNGGDGKRHRNEKGLAQRRPVEELAGDDEGHHPDHDQPELAAEPLEPLRQRWRRRGLGKLARDPADLRLDPGRDHHGLGAPGQHAGAGVHHGRAVGDRRLRLKLLARGLLNRVGFAGQRRFVRSCVERLEKARVGGHAVAGFEQHYVARHETAAFDQLDRAVAQHTARRRDRRAKRGSVNLGTPFLRAADRGVQDEDGADEPCVGELAERDRYRRRGKQQIDERALKLSQENAEHRAAWRLRKRVRTVLLKSCLGFRRREPCARSREPLYDRLGRQRMPRHAAA